jgi:hypothetical protein
MGLSPLEGFEKPEDGPWANVRNELMMCPMNYFSDFHS